MVDFDNSDTVLTQLAEMATDSGLKLLTPFSIIDVEMFGLMRCINTLNSLCRNATPQQINLVQQVSMLVYLYLPFTGFSDISSVRKLQMW